MRRNLFGGRVFLVALLLSAALAMSCAGGPLTTREKAAGIGAIGGAATGAMIGSASGHAGTGALIGGALGLGAGALIGDQFQAQEQRQQELERSRAELERERRELERLRRYQAEEAPAREVVVIERERGGPPPWAPAHGWRRKQIYYYYPEVEVYYYPAVARYYWLERGEWRVGTRLPTYYVIEEHRKIELELDFEPHTQHARIKNMYPPDHFEKRRGSR